MFQIKRVYDIIPSNSGVSVVEILKRLNIKTYIHIRAREWKGAKNEIFKDDRVSVPRYSNNKRCEGCELFNHCNWKMSANHVYRGAVSH